MSITAAPRRTLWPRVAHLARRAWAMEIHGYQNAFRFLFRRPRVPAGNVGFSYHQPVMPVLIVFIVVSAVEIVVVDLIVHRWWPAGRIPLLVLGIWGVTFMLGLLFGMLVRQHAIGPDGIRVRSGSEVDLPLTWDDIDAVAPRKRTVQEKAPAVTVDEQGEATLHRAVYSPGVEQCERFVGVVPLRSFTLMSGALRTWRKPTDCLLGGSGKPWASLTTSPRRADRYGRVL